LAREAQAQALQAAGLAVPASAALASALAVLHRQNPSPVYVPDAAVDPRSYRPGLIGRRHSFGSGVLCCSSRRQRWRRQRQIDALSSCCIAA